MQFFLMSHFRILCTNFVFANSLSYISNGTVRFKVKIYMPKIADLIEQLLREAHKTPYSVHPGTTKAY